MTTVRSEFLKDLKDSKSEVSIYLTNGIKLQGCVKDFDDSVILLARGPSVQMIERTSTSTIVPTIAAK